MKKNILKIAALVVALTLIVGVCIFANSLVGNPISKMLATNTAKQYIKENHPDMDYQLDAVTFNFKFVCYNAYFTSPSSPDSSFSLMLGMDGKIVQNYYEANVIERGNTHADWKKRIELQWARFWIIRHSRITAILTMVSCSLSKRSIETRRGCHPMR